MNISKKTHNLVLSALIGALYVALTFAQELLLPGTTSMAVHFRISEALTVLALFTPAAIPGLTVGCVISNLVALGALPFDALMGSAATFFACFAIYKLRNFCLVKDVPVFAFMMPALFNGIIIGMEIEIFFVEGAFHFSSFLLQGGLVALGELGVLFSLGTLLTKVIKGKKLEKHFNIN